MDSSDANSNCWATSAVIELTDGDTVRAGNEEVDTVFESPLGECIVEEAAEAVEVLRRWPRFFFRICS